ncbi:MAG: PTS sugar transporter subunit IIA [Candidatus Tantalella remota]|nr:PTS sugar transporter subunit IIA [Candidatus Tantalella remota]
MIDISQYLNSQSMVPELKASTKEGAIKLLIEKIYQEPGGDDIAVSKDEAYNSVMNRESLQSTGIGNELAFPHARIEGWGEFRLAMGVLRDGVDFNSLDGNPAKFIFLMISSPEQPYMILQAMAAIIRFIGDMGPEGEILSNSIKIDRILNIMQKKEIEATEHVLAYDIARPVKDFVTLKTPIEDVTQKMHIKRISILPVVQDDNRFYGEISCHDIFTFGMPDFFRQLQTISFVKHVDPFEKYFSINKGLRVEDLGLKEGTGIKKDSTLLEIVFELAVKKKSKLFMLEDDRTLAGVIDRFSIIDKILFF